MCQTSKIPPQPQATKVNDLALTLRPANQRGHVDHGWLKAAHSFSFGSYYNRNNMHFALLRVINEDHIAPNMGFPTHPHENFEIFTYPISGRIAHKDSMGNSSEVGAGEIQYMSAGSGVEHSEFNPSTTEQTHLLQIWLMPNSLNTTPRYENRRLPLQQQKGAFHLFLSPDGRDGSIAIHSDSDVYAALFDKGMRQQLELPEDKVAYVHVVQGNININNQQLKSGDALEVLAPGLLEFSAQENSELLVFIMPANPQRPKRP
ncbi:pirin family protein [Polycladidibacter stylochi]|uniref:pirin family protein n=1 Tax=Polycladidibacter stylochi TaxID=1807766 RepID=UPI00082ABED4|nr:pirin family protein [Pseudovibrio stylochi]